MENPTSKILTTHISAYRRPALIAAILTVLLGLAAANLFSVRAQNQSKASVAPGQEQSSRLPVEARSSSQQVVANWLEQGGRRTTFDEYLYSLKGNERLNAQILPVRGSSGGGGQPTNVIIIYDANGTPRICIGKASACKEAMK